MTSRVPTPESGKSVPTDTVLSAVANKQRRAVLRALDHTDEKAMEFSALVDQVTEYVRNGAAPDEHRQRVRATLHHNHLPKLESCGMIVYDTETKQVRNVTGELGKELLKLVDAHETRG